MLHFATFFTALLAATAVCFASPMALTKRTADEVSDPHITSPTTGSIWPAGSQQVVTWDTTSLPPDSMNTFGIVLLGHLSDGSEHLNVTNPLASNFKLGQGQVSVTVPEVETRLDYIIALLGDSGNISPTFTILNPGDVSVSA